MGKTRDLFKKIRDTKQTFHAKMGTINNRNGMDLTKAEDSKKRWQEYTEELWKKVLMTQITMRCDHSPRARHSSMQVMLALQSITTSKASDGDIMAVELFQILQDDAVEVLHSICSKFGKISRGRSGKGQFSLQSQRKAMPKKCSSYYTIALISHTSKELLKNLQAMLQ